MKNKKKMVKKRQLNKKRFTALIIILAVVIALTLTFIFFRDRLFSNKFEWNGMTWYKQRVGSIVAYRLQLAIYRVRQNETYDYTLYLRNDPRKLEKIPTDVTKKIPGGKVYISFDKESLECKNTPIAAYELGTVIGAFGHDAEAAFASPDLINQTTYENMTRKVRNCSDAKYDMSKRQVISVVLLKGSDKPYSYMHQESYCYILEIANCESIETAERFILALIEIMKQEIEEMEQQQTNQSNQSNQSS